MPRPLRVLVTGAAGFIGSHVVDHLVAAGHEVVALDRRGAGAPGPTPGHDHAEGDDGGGQRNPGATWVVGDVRDPEVWERHAAGADAISHQAATVGLGVDLADIRDYVDHNDAGTAAGLWALHRAGWGGRFVLASSMVVYGEGSYRCRGTCAGGGVRPPARQRDDLDAGCWDPPCPGCGAPLAWEPIGEDAPTDPRNVYAATKLHQEHLVATFAREHALAAVALRYHNVYGPRMPRDTPYAGVAALFRSRLAAGRPPRVFEDGGQARDLIHVADVARANVAALTAGGPERPEPGPGRERDGAARSGAGTVVPGLRAYNIASGTPVTVLDVARGLAVAVGGPAPEVVGGYRLGDVRHIVASPRRARDELGFAARVTLDEGLAAFAG